MNRRQFSAFLIASGLAHESAAKAAWKLATGYRGESFHTVNVSAMAQEVDRATQGGLRIDVHSNNSLVKLNAIREAVERGQIDAGETIMSSLVAEMPIAGADSVPFIVSSYNDARRMWRHQRPLIEREFTRRGMQVLYAVPWPPQGLYSTKPIGSTADLKGSRMRTYNQTTARLAELVGAQGVDVPMVEVGKAMAEGRIDSMITSAVTGVENQVWNHVRYYYEVNAWFPKNIVFANAKAMMSLAPAQRDTLLKACAAADARGWAASEAAAANSVEELRRNGMKIERVSRDFSMEIKRLGEKFSLEWIRKVGREANDLFIPYFMEQ